MKKLTKEKKIALTDAMAEELRSSRIDVLVNFAGLSVAEMEKLRRQVREKKARMKVLKNTLLEKCLKKVKQEELSSHLGEQVFIAWTRETDETGVVRTLLDFKKATRKIELKAGFLDGRVLNAEQLDTMGNLPSRKMLEATLVARLKLPFLRILNAVQYPAQKLVQTINLIVAKKGAS